MRLIHTKTLEISEFRDDEVPSFAILSHTWGDEEVSLQEMTEPISRSTMQRKGHEKVARCCSIASQDGYEYAWIDTCCIDKSSSSELSEAINSMYHWYEEAGVCYAYLSDVPTEVAFPESRWFQRGWTLQELIAPSALIFFDDQWNKLGTKASLKDEITKRTGIPSDVLLGGRHLDALSVAQKMSWAAGRETSRIEDRAYSLMGIFGINMALIYGERENAFIRLQEEILKVADDHSIFAWKSGDDRGGLLATSPDAFADSGNILRTRLPGNSDSAIAISSKGIHLHLPFVGLDERGAGLAVLHCLKVYDATTMHVAIRVEDVDLTMESFVRIHHTELDNFDFSLMRRAQYPNRRLCIKRTRISRKKQEAFTPPDDDRFNQVESSPWAPHQTRREQLHRAAKEGNKGIVWLLLTQSDLERSDLAPALAFAVRKGRQSLVRMLLPRIGAELDVVGTVGETLLTSAAICGHDDIVRLLVAHGADLEVENSDHRTPLMCALLRDELNVAQLLVQSGANVGGVVGEEDQKTALWWAIHTVRPAHLKILLSTGDSPDTLLKTSPLAYAVNQPSTAVAAILLERGANPDRTFDIGTGESTGTALTYAAFQGNKDLAELLLQRGADPDCRSEPNHGNTPLTCAITSPHDQASQEEIVHLLLEAGANVERRGSGGRTPLTNAAIDGHLSLAKVLLDHGAVPDGRNNDGTTPLMHAVQNDRADFVQLLLDRGANPEAYDHPGVGRTAIAQAKSLGRRNIVRMLQKDVDERRVAGLGADQGTKPWVLAMRHNFRAP